MTQVLKPGPNGPILEIDPRMLEAAGIAPDARVEVRREGDVILIAAAVDETDPERERRFREAMEWTFNRYEQTLRRLSE